MQTMQLQGECIVLKIKDVKKRNYLTNCMWMTKNASEKNRGEKNHRSKLCRKCSTSLEMMISENRGLGKRSAPFL